MCVQTNKSFGVCVSFFGEEGRGWLLWGFCRLHRKKAVAFFFCFSR